MQKMNLSLPGFFFIIITVFSVTNTSAQPHFAVDTTYLTGTAISKVRSSFNGEIWFIDGNGTQHIYRITRTGDLEDHTLKFAVPLQSRIVDLVCPDTNEVVAGTSDQYAFRYKNGMLSRIDTKSGISNPDNQVNSLFLRRDIIKQYSTIFQDNTIFGIATPGEAYFSQSAEQPLTQIKGDFLNMQGKKFLSKDDYFLFSFPTPLGTQVRYYNYSLTMDYPLYSLEEYGEALCGNVMHYDNGGIYGSFIGFEKGFITRSQLGYYRFLTSQAIHAIVEIRPYGTLIAADSGLYYSGDVMDLAKIDLNIGEFAAYDIENSNGNIYIATNKGLLKIFLTDCSVYKADFDQDKQYADIEKYETVQFNAGLSNGTKSVLWDFGDSTFSNKPFVTHTYSKNGNYRIKLTSSNGYCTNSTSNILVALSGTSGQALSLDDISLIPANDYSSSVETICVADLDGDIQPELFLPPLAFYKLVQTDTIRFIPEEFSEAWIHKAVIGDLNNDGLNEIISGTDIFINDGNLNFTKKTISGETVFYSTSPSCLLDYNNDGKLDIAAGDEYKFAVFINKGNFNFEKVNGLFDSESAPMGINWFDIDNDDDPDLWLNRGYYYPNSLYINYNGSFKKKDYGLLTSLHGQSIVTGDLNNDKKADLYLSDYDRNYLFISIDDTLKSSNATWLTNEFYPLMQGISMVMQKSSLADFDNNGYQDCLKDNNRIFMNYGNMVFKNRLDSQFTSIGLFGLTNIGVADISNDGKVDLILDNAGISFQDNIHRDMIMFNTTNTKNHWIKFNCLGTKSNYNAIGAKIFVKSKNTDGDFWQYRYIESSQNNSNQNGYELHFGLADSPEADTTEVLWPSGQRSYYAGLAADKTYTLVEPFIRYEGETTVCENEPALLTMPKADDISYEWTLNDTLVQAGGNQHRIRKPGEYKCIIHYALFTDTTASIVFHLKKVSPSTIRFEKDSIFCPGDSIRILSAEYPGASYRWLFDGSYDSTEISPSVYYSGNLPLLQILKNDLNCYDTSNILYPKHHPVPQVKFRGSAEFCDGDTVVISVDSIYTKYLWSDSDTTFTTKLSTNKPLYVQIWNEYNCLSTDTFKHVVWPVPFSNLGTDRTIAFSDVIYLDVCVPNSQNYTYNWFDGPGGCNRYIRGEKLNIGKHSLSLEVISDHECSSSDTIMVEVLLSTKYETLNEKDVLVFPNPSYGEFKIYVNNNLVSTNTVISIFDQAGNLLDTRTFNLKYPQVVDFKFERKGTGQYILRVSGNNHYSQEKILIL